MTIRFECEGATVGRNTMKFRRVGTASRGTSDSCVLCVSPVGSVVTSQLVLAITIGTVVPQTMGSCEVNFSIQITNNSTDPLGVDIAPDIIATIGGTPTAITWSSNFELIAGNGGSATVTGQSVVGAGVFEISGTVTGNVFQTPTTPVVSNNDSGTTTVGP